MLHDQLEAHSYPENTKISSQHDNPGRFEHDEGLDLDPRTKED